MNKDFVYPLFLFCILFASQIFAQGTKREIEWSDYPYPISEEHEKYRERVKFGHIIVPETRNSDNPRTLKITFCILKGTSDNGMQNPIIRLPGGPGGSMTAGAHYYFPAPNYVERFKFADVVLFDPRGCGKSEPDLCPGMDLPQNEYQMFLGRTQKEMERETLKVLKHCLDSLALEKVDLNAYGSDEVAEDIEDLRVSLGVEKWNVQGGSYGTRYGQGLIRKFPESVRSAVFSGLVPTTRKYDDDALRSFSRSLQIILNKCSADEDCAREYPNLENSLFEALEYYNQNPLIVSSNEQKLLKNRDVVITGDLILQGIFILSYGGLGPEIMPKLIQAISLRKDWVIKNFVNSMGDTFGSIESDMNLFINLNDNPSHGLHPNSENYNEFTKKLKPYFTESSVAFNLELAELCGIKRDSTQEVPIPSEVPVILNTGEFDPVTPPENTFITAEYLTNSMAFTFPDNGHWVKSPKCFSELITSFYKNPVIPKNIDDCISQTESLKFVTGVSYNKGIAQIGSTILMGKENQIYIPMGIFIFMILFGFLGFPIQSVVHYFKRKKNSSVKKNKTNWMTWVMSFLGIVFILLFYLGILDSMARNAYILGFGILSSWNWIFWIAVLVVMTLIYSLLNGRRILKTNINTFSRSLTLITWAGTSLFIGLLFYWKVLWPFSN